MKRSVKVLVGILIVLILAAVVIGLMIDSIAKAGVERGGTYALGVDTKVDSLSLSLLSGRLTMDGLRIANPEGYKTAHLMKSGRFDVEVETGSVLTDTIRIPRFELDGLDLNIEQKLGKTNVGEVMDHLKQLSGDEAKKEGGKELNIDSVVIRNVKATVQVLPIGGQASTVTVEVPLIELKNLTPENRKGIVLGELIQKLFPAIMGGVLDKGGDLLPAGLKGDLTKNVEGLKKITEDATKKLKEAGQKVIEGVGKDVGDVGKKLDDLLKK